MIRMEVSGVYNSSPQSSYPQVVLKEVDGPGHLPIIIGRFEAAAISMAQSDQKPARPISYDLAQQILLGVNSKITKVEITDLHESTYYAEIHLVDEDGGQLLGEEPSDTLDRGRALAASTRCVVRRAVANDDRARIASRRHEGLHEFVEHPLLRAVDVKPSLRPAPLSERGPERVAVRRVRGDPSVQEGVLLRGRDLGFAVLAEYGGDPFKPAPSLALVHIKSRRAVVVRRREAVHDVRLRRSPR